MLATSRRVSMFVQRRESHLCSIPTNTCTRWRVAVALLVVLLLPASTFAQDASTPLLTPEGVKWGKKVVRNARIVAAGKIPSKPPNVDPAIAADIETIEACTRGASKWADDQNELDSFLDGDAFETFVARITDQIAEGSTIDPGFLGSLIEALNSQSPFFPPLPANRRAALPQSFLAAAFVDGLGRNTIERKTDGLRVSGDQLISTGGSQRTDIDFVNGIQNELAQGLANALELSSLTQRRIGHIHNASGTALADILQAIFDYNKLDGSTAVSSVREEILQHAAFGRSYLLICHSQGAAICAQALADARRQNPDLASKIGDCVQIITLGGFTQRATFPATYRDNVTSFVNADDPVPDAALAIDFLAPARVVKGLLGGLVNLALHQAKYHVLGAYTPKLCTSAGDCPTVRMAEANLHQRCGVCSDDADCNPGATSSTSDGDADCLTKICDPANPSADSKGCAVAGLEAAGSPCDDGLATTVRDSCDAIGLCLGSLCGNGTIDPGEICDVNSDVACPGACGQPGSLAECLCPSCGDGIIEGTEECDDGANGVCDECDDHCRAVSRVSPTISAWIEDNFVVGDRCFPGNPQWDGYYQGTGTFDLHWSQDGRPCDDPANPDGSWRSAYVWLVPGSSPAWTIIGGCGGGTYQLAWISGCVIPDQVRAGFNSAGYRVFARYQFPDGCLSDNYSEQARIE